MNNRTAPRIGIHTSIAGGLSNAVESAVAKGCDTFQIFARNPRGWLERPLSRDEVSKFRMARERAGLWPVAVHSPLSRQAKASMLTKSGDKSPHSKGRIRRLLILSY